MRPSVGEIQHDRQKTDLPCTEPNVTSTTMWFMKVLQETMKELVIDWTLNNVVLFTVITSSSVLSVLGALRHIYSFAQKIQAGKAKTSSKNILKKYRGLTPQTELQNQEIMERQYLLINQHRKNALIKDSMLYQKALQKVRENTECLKSLECSCESPFRRCIHSLCRRCCERSGWCRRMLKGHQTGGAVSQKSKVMTQRYSIQLSHKFLHEVPHRLGFHCMGATSINMSHNVLSHLPEHMALIRQLHKMNLSHNILKNIPHFFSSFHRLSILDLRHNRLTRFPEVLLELTSLQKLYLDHNALCQVPSEICRLQLLVQLGLGYNSLSNIPSSLFKICTLKLLRVCGNCGLKSLPTEISCAISLEVLDVSNCSLQSVPASLGHCSMLKHLILSNNRILHLPCEISQCCRLINLNVSKNPLSSLPAMLFYRSRSLSLSALCPSFPTNPGPRSWYLKDGLPTSLEGRSAVSLFHLARVCIKQNDLDVSILPSLLKEELSSYASCFHCGCKSTERSLRILGFSTFGGDTGPVYPFLYTLCSKHLDTGPEDRVLAQIESLLTY